MGVLVGKAQPTISQQWAKALTAIDEKFASKHLRKPVEQILRDRPEIIKRLMPEMIAIFDGLSLRCSS
jgi:hypothetical protein